MTASPAAWGPPDPQRGSDEGASGEVLDFYKVAVDEYRFQATHNWTRTQYLLAFNVAVAGLGVLLSTRTGAGSIAVFALGAVAALLTAAVTRIQHDYYRAARDRMQRIEETLDLPLGWATDTTATMGNRKRTISVTRLIYLLLFAVAVVDIVSIVVVLT